MKRLDGEWARMFASYSQGTTFLEHEINRESIARFAQAIRQEALNEAAELVLKTSTLPTFEWLSDKIKKLNE